MAIDGRTIKQQQEKDAAVAAYESKGLGVLAALIIWVPIAAFLGLMFWAGWFVWPGGMLGGVINVASTAATFGGLWAWRRMRRG